jgi:outer membrane protein OmpA-like peptidoglycan-associated protein
MHSRLVSHKSLLLLLAMMACVPSFAQKKNFVTRRGDAAFSRFDFESAAFFYNRAVAHHGDSLYLYERIAESYRKLGDYKRAETYYSRLASTSAATPIVKYHYAECLRANQKYAEAKAAYIDYQRSAPSDKTVQGIIDGFDKIDELSKPSKSYQIEIAPISGNSSDFGPAYYKNNQLFYTSNRTNKFTGLNDRWSGKDYYQLYIGKMDSVTHNATSGKMVKSRLNRRFQDGPSSYNAANGMLYVTRSNYKSNGIKTAADKKTVNLKIYEGLYPTQGKLKLTSLPFNSNDYSVAHAVVTKDGSTMYFTSDMPGGQGGTDIYMSRKSGTTWEQPVNLGAGINTKDNEMFPFIADDGTLYFASNGYAGLGGLDIYKSNSESSQWTVPVNLGSPINSNGDDFGLIVDGEGKNGFFASNRAGGMGDDDIYRFAYDKGKERISIPLKVVDAATGAVIEGASVMATCNAKNAPVGYSDRNGMAMLGMPPSGNGCDVEVTKDGYQIANKQITPSMAGSPVEIAMVKINEQVKLILAVRERDTKAPLRDVPLSIINSLDLTEQTLFTDAAGIVSMPVPRGQTYAVKSPSFSSITESITTDEAQIVSGEIRREYLVGDDQRVVTVPLSGSCFDANATVKVTNLSTNTTTISRADDKGNLNLALLANTTYRLESNAKTADITTKSLKPGQEVNMICKFYVGQTWVINNIYYDLNKSEIRPDAAKELNSVVTIMKNHPTLDLELSSHTDCRQTQAYNDRLSAQRAISAINYVISKGVDRKRLIAIGYGERRLSNSCACEPTNDSPCSDADHQANRRTELKVLRY